MYEVCMSADKRVEPSFNAQQGYENSPVQEQYFVEPSSVKTLSFEDDNHSSAGSLLLKSGLVVLFLITLYTGNLIWKNTQHNQNIASLNTEQGYVDGHNPPKKIRQIDLTKTASLKKSVKKKEDSLKVKSILQDPAPKVVKTKSIKKPTVQTGTKIVPQTAKAAKHYVVQPGDTFSRIGRLYKMSASKIMEINAIENPRSLKPGMKIIITQ